MNERQYLKAHVAFVEGVDRVTQENGQDLVPRSVLGRKLWQHCPLMLDYIHQRCAEGWILVSITPALSDGKDVLFERLISS